MEEVSARRAQGLGSGSQGRGALSAAGQFCQRETTGCTEGAAPNPKREQPPAACRTTLQE